MVVEELKEAFPEFYAVDNVLDTSMNNTNPPVHVPFCLFNITRMANGEDAQFYGECLPPILLEFTMAADAERCAVSKAIGGTPKTILELMNAAWKVDYDNIKDLGLNNASLKSVKLPKSLVLPRTAPLLPKACSRCFPQGYPHFLQNWG